MSSIPLMPPELVKARNDTATGRSIMITFTALLVWDGLSLIPRETRLGLWSSKDWSIMKSLYLLNRIYSPLALIFASLYTVLSIPTEVCRRSWWALLVSGDIVFAICDLMLIIRVYAVYERSRAVLGCLLVLWLAELGMFARAVFDVGPLRFPPVVAEYVGFDGCAAAAKPDSAVSGALLGWLPSLLINLVVLAMILWRSISIRLRVGTVPLLKQIQSDGIVYFVVVVTINVISLGFAAQHRPALQSVALPPWIAITSIACSRLVLSLRSRGSESGTVHFSVLDSHQRRDSRQIGEGG